MRLTEARKRTGTPVRSALERARSFSIDQHLGLGLGLEGDRLRQVEPWNVPTSTPGRHCVFSTRAIKQCRGLMRTSLAPTLQDSLRLE